MSYTDYQLRHVQQRAWERYGIILSREDVCHLDRLCREGYARFLSEAPRGAQICELWWGEAPLQLLREQDTGRICTVLPLSWRRRGIWRKQSKAAGRWANLRNRWLAGPEFAARLAERGRPLPPERVLMPV